MCGIIGIFHFSKSKPIFNTYENPNGSHQTPLGVICLIAR